MIILEAARKLDFRPFEFFKEFGAGAITPSIPRLFIVRGRTVFFLSQLRNTVFTVSAAKPLIWKETRFSVYGTII